jgi:DNA mismatch repair protein MutL
MGVINVLSIPVVNKIAAGEVIERPASVVKELVENALDAQATFIEVEIEDGGRKLIRVADDGVGMGLDDLALAFESHATSKLETSDDLEHIVTMGFRGEALASIGSVSHAKIVSRPRDSVEGGVVEANGGQPEAPKVQGAPEGTSVEIANLFFNVPARLKFLKRASTEYAHIVDLVSRMALVNPHVTFKLTHNGRETLNVKATDDRRRRLADLYDKELAKVLLEVDSGDGPVRVKGFVAPPIHCRSNSKMQLTYVNGRLVRDRRISHALASAYEGLLTRGRYPVAFLFIEMDPREVDVNVHPTKIEVRFHQGQMVYKTVLNAVREPLRGADLTPVFEAPERPAPPTSGVMPLGGAQGSPFSRPLSPPRVGGGGGVATPFDRPIRRPEAEVIDRREETAGAGPEPPRRPAHQYANSYIVEERGDGLAIIDQHALHERIIFDAIRRRLETAKLESQRMLIPAVVNLDKAEIAALLAEKDTLAELGIEVSEFGTDALAVNSLPTVLGSSQPEAVLRDFLGELDESGDSPVESRKLAMAKMIACKAAVKAGDRLTDSEMASLLEKADLMPERDTCPHGRPTCIFLPFSDLERQFKRK